MLNQFSNQIADIVGSTTLGRSRSGGCRPVSGPCMPPSVVLHKQAASASTNTRVRRDDGQVFQETGGMGPPQLAVPRVAGWARRRSSAPLRARVGHLGIAIARS